MKQLAWQKSTYCAQGDSCVHIAATDGRVHLTESSDPTGSILTVTPAAFGALLTALQEDTRPPAAGISVAASTGGALRVHATGAPEPALTTDRHKWETFVRGVRAGEFDHFAS
jgi:hypothetical protein